MTEQIKIVVTKAQRLDEFLREKISEFMRFPIESGMTKEMSSLGLTRGSLISNSKIRRLIFSGNVLIDSKIIKNPSFVLKVQSTVIINFEKAKFFYEKKPDDIEFTLTEKDVLYEDENLIFINKPAFFPVEQTITHNRENLHDKVVEYLWKKNPNAKNPPYVGIMHRLDRETSGVILFTKNRTINKQVSDMFVNHNFIKTYYAVCLQDQNHKEYKVGQSFSVEMYMGRITSKSQKGKWGKVNKDSGQYSKTEFYIKKQITVEGKKCFLIECNLFTGRTHQIRVHLSSKNLHILGDTLYGGSSAKRMYLHAYSLKADTKDLKFHVIANIPND